MNRGKTLTIGLVATILILTLVFLVASACGSSTESDTTTTHSNGSGSTTGPVFSQTALQGEAVFNANCALCHGLNASGTTQGPTFIDRIYHPAHHADLSFRFAAKQGVRSHHWRFGDMPPVPNVTEDDVEKVICYVRELQRFNGVFEEEEYLNAC